MLCWASLGPKLWVLVEERGRIISAHGTREEARDAQWEHDEIREYRLVEPKKKRAGKGRRRG